MRNTELETGQVLRGLRLHPARDVPPCAEAEVCQQEVPSRIRLQLRLREPGPGQRPEPALNSCVLFCKRFNVFICTKRSLPKQEIFSVNKMCFLY